jgi:hypothetical protein
MNTFLGVRRSLLRATLAVGLGVMLSGCASTVRIGDLMAAPQRYDGRTVRVEGTVTRSAGVLGIGGYELDDGTGQIFVVAQGGGVPAQGARTRVKGRFESIFSLAGRSIAAIMQEAQSPR